MNESQMTPLHTENLVANNANTAYGVGSIAWNSPWYIANIVAYALPLQSTC